MNPDIITRAMRNLTLLVIVLAFAAAAARAQTITPSGVPAECGAIVVPSATEIEPWLAGSAWAEALRFHLKARYSKAEAAFLEKWATVSAELKASFGTATCDYDKVNASLDSRVFKAPPDVIPMEEDFGLPLPVSMVAADSSCRVGNVTQAAKWLRPAAASGNLPALAALVVLESSQAPSVASARIPRSGDDLPLELALAGCVASIREGRPDAAWCGRVEQVCDSRQCFAIREIVRTLMGDGPEASGDPR